MIELGGGNRPIDMLSYAKGGKTWILINTFRTQHDKKPVGPSPYWAARIDAALMAGTDKVNEKAIRRSGKGDAGLQIAETFHGVVQMDKLDDARALAVRKTETGYDLEVLALP